MKHFNFPTIFIRQENLGDRDFILYSMKAFYKYLMNIEHQQDNMLGFKTI